MNNELLLNALKTAYNNENIRLKLNSAKDYDELALILQQENIIQCTAKDLSDLMSNMKNNELNAFNPVPKTFHIKFFLNCTFSFSIFSIFLPTACILLKFDIYF